MGGGFIKSICRTAKESIEIEYTVKENGLFQHKSYRFGVIKYEFIVANNFYLKHNDKSLFDCQMVQCRQFIQDQILQHGKAKDICS